jgi:hypothetical protein
MIPFKELESEMISASRNFQIALLKETATWVVGGAISKGAIWSYRAYKYHRWVETAIAAEKATVAVSAAEVVAVETGIEAANGLKITGFTGHGVDRAIGSFGRSGVSPSAILDAIKSPLKINNIVTDQLGRQSQRFVGQFGEVVVNPQAGRIISVNPTSSSKAARLLKQLGQ